MGIEKIRYAHFCCVENLPESMQMGIEGRRFLHIDRDLTVTGRLPHIGSKMKPLASDPKFVVKILLESIDKKDFEQHKSERHEDDGIDIKK